MSGKRGHQASALGDSQRSVAPAARSSASQVAVVCGVALLLVFAGFVVGRLSGSASSVGDAVTSGPAAGRGWLPAADAPGEDFSRLPRFPGSLRVDFDRQLVAGWVVTDVDYLAAASMPVVKQFYRRSFDPQGWQVADVNFVRGEWSFLLLRGSTEVTLEIARRGPLVEVDIEQSQRSQLSAPGSAA